MLIRTYTTPGAVSFYFDLALWIVMHQAVEAWDVSIHCRSCTVIVRDQHYDHLITVDRKVSALRMSPVQATSSQSIL